MVVEGATLEGTASEDVLPDLGSRGRSAGFCPLAVVEGVALEGTASEVVLLDLRSLERSVGCGALDIELALEGFGKGGVLFDRRNWARPEGCGGLSCVLCGGGERASRLKTFRASFLKCCSFVVMMVPRLSASSIKAFQSLCS